MKHGIRVRILDGDPAIKPQKNFIQTEVRRAIKRVARFISIQNVDIVVSHRPHDVGEGVVCGESYGKHQMFISVDALCDDFQIQFQRQCLATVAHELYHLARNQGFRYAEGLLDHLVEEGLAVHFEWEVRGEKPPKQYRNFHEDQLKKLAHLAKKDAGKKSYSYDEWFHGSRKRGIPRNAGYALGYAMIHGLFALYPDLTPSTVIHKDVYKLKALSHKRTV